MGHVWTLHPLVIISCCFLCVVIGESENRIVATAPVKPVEEGGILALHCQIWSLESEEEVTIVKGGSKRLSIDDVLASKADDRMYLAVRQLQDGSMVYFFTIMDVRREDEGEYACKITHPDNTNKEIESSVTFRTKYFPSDSNPQCESIDMSKVRIGQTVTLSCSSDEGYPQVSIQWSQTKSEHSYKDMTTTTVRNGRVYSELTFKVSHKDVGSIFMCTVESDAFPEEKRNCHVGPLELERKNPGMIIHDVITTSLLPSNNRPVSTLNPPDNDRKTSIIPQDCRELCSSYSLSLTYWTIGTIAAGVVALMLCIWVVILFIKFRNLHRTSKTGGYIAGRQLPEGIYSEVEANYRCNANNSMYITLEKKKKRVEQGLPRDIATHLLQQKS